MPHFSDAQNGVYGTDRLTAFVAIMIGVAMPLRASGVAAQQASLGLAFVAVLVALTTTPSASSLIRKALFSKLGAAVACVFIAWGASLFFSFDPYASVKIYARTGGFILAAVLIWSVLCSRPNAQNLMWKSMIVAGLVFSILALLSINGVPYILSALKGRLLEQEAPYQAFKAFAATAMCLMPPIIWSARKLGGPWLWGGYAFVPMALILMVQTSNRAALAGTVAMSILVAIRMLTVRNKYFIPILLLAVTVAVAAVSWVVFQEIDNAKDMGVVSRANAGHLYLPGWLIDQHRQYIWKFAFERFLENPWFGNGIDQINKLPHAKDSIPYMDGSAPWLPSHPHNWAIEILAETGIFGFITFVVALALSAWGLFRRYQINHDESVFTLIVFMGGFWLSSLFNFSFWATWWQLTFVVIFAMLVSAYKPKSSAGKNQP